MTDQPVTKTHCSQCGQRFSDRACGPTHALIHHEQQEALMRDTYDLEVKVEPKGYAEVIDITMEDITKGTEHLVSLIEKARGRISDQMSEDEAHRITGYRFRPDPNEDLRFSVHVSRYGMVMPEIVRQIGTAQDRLRFIEAARSHNSQWSAMTFTLKVGRVNEHASSD